MSERHFVFYFVKRTVKSTFTSGVMYKWQHFVSMDSLHPIFS